LTKPLLQQANDLTDLAKQYRLAAQREWGLWGKDYRELKVRMRGAQIPVIPQEPFTNIANNFETQAKEKKRQADVEKADLEQKRLADQRRSKNSVTKT